MEENERIWCSAVIEGFFPDINAIKYISNTGFVKKTTFMRLLILYYLKSFVKFPIKQMNHLIFIFKWFQCNTQQHMPQTRCRKVYTLGLFHKQAQVFWALLQSSPRNYTETKSIERTLYFTKQRNNAEA